MAATGKFETIGHHTCEDRLPEDENRAPFLCTDTNSFLGKGYYFWEENIPMGKHWGSVWYMALGKEYLVCEFAIQCDFHELFDLVGNRRHQHFLASVRKKLAGKRPEKYKWPIGKLLELLRRSNTIAGPFEGQFSYKLIRAVDNSFAKMSQETLFSETRENFIDLNPCYIICVTDKKGIILELNGVVHKSKKPV